jgi:hypothetical protein
MLEEAHKALEAMSAASAAMKAEEWGVAERSLRQVQETVARQFREVGEKSWEVMMAPPADRGSRG